MKEASNYKQYPQIKIEPTNELRNSTDALLATFTTLATTIRIEMVFSLVNTRYRHWTADTGGFNFQP